MSRVERGYTPITEANTENVSFDIPFPEYLKTGEIGVNLRRIHRLCRLAGIAHLSIVGSSGETSTFIPTIVGHNQQGGAYAGRLGVRKNVPTHSEDLQRNRLHEQEVPAELRWNNAVIRINMDEVTDRIQHSGEKGTLRSPRLWAKHTNKALKQGVGKIAVENLITKTASRDKVEFISYFMFLTAFESAINLNHPDQILPKAAMVMAFRIPISLIFDQAHYGFSLRDFRFSFFPGIQFDRALAARTLAKTSTLIKSTE